MPSPKIITRNIWILSLVSLFTDVASEMLYPVMPLYLKSIGFTIVAIGVLEGFAEATAGLSKGFFGNWSDKAGRRLPFVQAGYGLSAVSKPMMALFTFPFWIFLARTLDRLGKGIRTGARDALLSDETTPEHKGKVFGFHRSMDTLGAVVGPAAALLFLHYFPDKYKPLFILAFIPGAIAIIFTFLIREHKVRQVASNKKAPAFFDFMHYWKSSPALYRKLIIALLVFTLFNSSDVFLLLKVKEAGFDDSMVIGVYIFYNLIYAFSSYPMGLLADKIGMKKVYVMGLFLFAIAYAGMVVADAKWIYFALFLVYGMYAAATEGIAKAWISNMVPKAETATAIGTYTAFQSIATLLASSLAGFIWYNAGSAATFLLSSMAAAAVALYLLTFKVTATPQMAS
ncbi:MFS transporter [Pontibacter vulgaris]|uniref:MFS transporter n=1 Tax=Pontibacter vulgaris TaxID=2905679 RepID=UPI001FA6EA26|nr:MFS transporter [Pontibacter vulgaris]